MPDVGNQTREMLDFPESLFAWGNSGAYAIGRAISGLSLPRNPTRQIREFMLRSGATSRRRSQGNLLRQNVSG